MPMRETSLLAWDEVCGYLGPKQRDVLTVFAEHLIPLCDLQVAAILHWPINCVTPRRGELVRMGLLLDDGQREWQGRRRHFWRRAEGLFLTVDLLGRPLSHPSPTSPTSPTPHPQENPT